MVVHMHACMLVLAAFPVFHCGGRAGSCQSGHLFLLCQGSYHAKKCIENGLTILVMLVLQSALSYTQKKLGEAYSSASDLIQGAAGGKKAQSEL